MKVFNSYISGFKMSFRAIKMTLLIYCVNLTLALLVVFPLFNSLKAGFGRSMLPDALLKEFDYTSLTEFLSTFKGIGGFIAQARWIILLYLIVSIFFSGGILFVFNRADKFSVKAFLNGCVLYFFRFLKLFIYMLTFNLLIALIIYIPMSIIINGVKDSVTSEASLFYIVLVSVIIHLILLIILQMVTFYTKIRIASEDSRKVFMSIFRSMKFIFKHFVNTFPLFLLQLIVPAILLIVLFFFNGAIGMTSGITILIMFFIQQMFIFSRVFTRIWMFGSQCDLYSEYTELK